jgi:hypothetical protein
MMATKHFCDICGCEIPAGKRTELTIINPIPINGSDMFDMDLCAVCAADLRWYVHNRKEGKKVGYFNEEDMYDQS